jgi:hypothetical protein
MVADVTGGPGAKRVIVGFKEIPIREESLTAVQLLERAGLDPLEYELRIPKTGEPIASNGTIKIQDGMKLDANVKPR